MFFSIFISNIIHSFFLLFNSPRKNPNKVILQSLQDVTGAEFEMFMNFLKSLIMFGEKAPPERVQELIEIIEGQADLDIQFNVCIACDFLSICLVSTVFGLLLGADAYHILVNTAYGVGNLSNSILML